MAFKLTKQQRNERDEFADQLDAAKEKITVAVERANVLIDEYNAVVDAAMAWIEGVSSEWEEEYSEKSERWQESDRAQAVQQNLDEWLTATFDEVDRIELDEPEHADLLRELPPDLAEGE